MIGLRDEKPQVINDLDPRISRFSVRSEDIAKELLGGVIVSRPRVTLTDVKILGSGPSAYLGSRTGLELYVCGLLLGGVGGRKPN